MELYFVPDVPYNAAFFGLYERVFLLYREEHSEVEALDFMRKLFSRTLKSAYDQARFKKGSAEDFARVVGERDKSVGLHVRFPEISEDRIVYEFHTDPFPNLKGQIDPRILDSTYMEFKIDYMLGSEWSYETTEHIWENGQFTQHIITRHEGLRLQMPMRTEKEVHAVV